MPWVDPNFLITEVQHITRSLLRVDLSIVPDFQWDPEVHGGAEAFHIMVEDVDGEVILFRDMFTLHQWYSTDEHNVTLTVQIFEPVSQNYYISVISDRWLHAETRLPISFKHLIIPDKFPAPTLFLTSNPSTSNKIQTQLFQVCIQPMTTPSSEAKRAVCIEPYQDMVDLRVQEWQAKFSKVQGGKEIVSLTGGTSADLRLLEKGDVIFCTPPQWGVISRLPANSTMDIHLQSTQISHFPSLMISMSKPAYLANCEYAPTKVTVFVPSRQQCRLTVDDILTHCAADDQPDRFLNIELADLQPHLDHASDKGLAEVLSRGIGYYHEALSKQDKRIVQRLFESGAIQVLVASKGTAWSLPVASYMVIIMGVQYYETRKDFYKKFLGEGLPIEPHLPTYMLHDYFLAEVAVKTIENKQDAMDLLTWTYFYRRMTQNPNYYNLHNVSHQHLSDDLSELVENTLSDLVNLKCIAIEEDMDVSPLNLGMIAAYYNISYVTVEVYTLSLKERTKLKGLLEVVSSSAEFETIPIRRHEDTLFECIYDRVPVKIDTPNFEAPYFQDFPVAASPLLSSAPSTRSCRRPGPPCVDVMSSNAWLNALCAVDVSQMCVQGMWETDSPLKQIPHFESEAIKRCKDAGVNSVYDIMELEDDTRNKLLQMNPAQMCVPFLDPTLDVNHQLAKGDYTAGAPIYLQVALSRDADDEEDEEPSDPVVIAPYYPLKKMANWWLVVGDPNTRQLLIIKKVTGSHKLKLYVICDSYVGADHDISLDPIDIEEGEDGDSDEGVESDEELMELPDVV
ncbi:Sec63-domain-containing protein [Coprinopsis marcescibilis]|uniref:Sec63-domain-containing protein n=1 Tax=Coprinopsis marcescibilis TaxID=230819 RepID=A0A5C3KND9_COPMA|nr:Sec63-domain-containing protein [Coprinopsis marcescibilis]